MTAEDYANIQRMIDASIAVRRNTDLEDLEREAAELLSNLNRLANDSKNSEG